MGGISRLAAAGMALAFLAGCATTAWVKRDVSPDLMKQDLRECAREAGLFFDPKGLGGAPLAYSSKGTYATRLGDPFEKCMTGKGYRRESGPGRAGSGDR